MHTGRFLMSMGHIHICSLALAMSLAPVAAADPVEDFYRGKQIRIVIRATPGGNYDLYSRLLARYIVRFIPGNPTVIAVNMPGGSGLTALSSPWSRRPFRSNRRSGSMTS